MNPRTFLPYVLAIALFATDFLVNANADDKPDSEETQTEKSDLDSYLEVIADIKSLGRDKVKLNNLHAVLRRARFELAEDKNCEEDSSEPFSDEENFFKACKAAKAEILKQEQILWARQFLALCSLCKPENDRVWFVDPIANQKTS